VGLGSNSLHGQQYAMTSAAAVRVMHSTDNGGWQLLSVYLQAFDLFGKHVAEVWRCALAECS
jgi:hypothetical protein